MLKKHIRAFLTKVSNLYLVYAILIGSLAASSSATPPFSFSSGDLCSEGIVGQIIGYIGNMSNGQWWDQARGNSGEGTGGVTLGNHIVLIHESRYEDVPTLFLPKTKTQFLKGRAKAAIDFVISKTEIGNIEKYETKAKFALDYVPPDPWTKSENQPDSDFRWYEAKGIAFIPDSMIQGVAEYKVTLEENSNGIDEDLFIWDLLDKKELARIKRSHKIPQKDKIVHDMNAGRSSSALLYWKNCPIDGLCFTFFPSQENDGFFDLCTIVPVTWQKKFQMYTSKSIIGEGCDSEIVGRPEILR
jgi:hypothetical protein